LIQLSVLLCAKVFFKELGGICENKSKKTRHGSALYLGFRKKMQSFPEGAQRNGTWIGQCMHQKMFHVRAVVHGKEEKRTTGSNNKLQHFSLS